MKFHYSLGILKRNIIPYWVNLTSSAPKFRRTSTKLWNKRYFRIAKFLNEIVLPFRVAFWILDGTDKQKRYKFIPKYENTKFLKKSCVAKIWIFVICICVIKNVFRQIGDVEVPSSHLISLMSNTSFDSKFNHLNF